MESRDSPHFSFPLTTRFARYPSVFTNARARCSYSPLSFSFSLSLPLSLSLSLSHTLFVPPVYITTKEFMPPRRCLLFCCCCCCYCCRTPLIVADEKNGVYYTTGGKKNSLRTRHHSCGSTLCLLASRARLTCDSIHHTRGGNAEGGRHTRSKRQNAGCSRSCLGCGSPASLFRSSALLRIHFRHSRDGNSWRKKTRAFTVNGNTHAGRLSPSLAFSL